MDDDNGNSGMQVSPTYPESHLYQMETQTMETTKMKKWVSFTCSTPHYENLTLKSTLKIWSNAKNPWNKINE